MGKKQTSNFKQASLFDIRLKNLDHDILVLKGNEHDAASVLLAGKIALSVNEPLTVKRLSLRLYSTLRINNIDSVNSPRGSLGKPYRFEKKLYEHSWDDMEINLYLSNMYENSNSSKPIGINRSPNHSSTGLMNLGYSKRSKSSSNLNNSSFPTLTHTDSTSSLTSSKSNHILVQGNYEFPFSAVLPGDMPESVEGLRGASVVYKLEATIDRGKFHNKMVTKKHLRVLRTLTTDSVELSETVAVDNTWPKKVEYSLNVPSKAIAIGSNIPISFMLVPLLKGLRLGDIKIQLVEYSSCVGYLPPAHSEERIVVSKTISQPNENDPDFQMDKWEIDNYLKVPDSLSKCTQDCDIQNFIKVRHKLKFTIGLINPDNHVSELRASLPVQLFISPFVSIKAKYLDLDDDVRRDSGNENSNYDEELLFSSNNGSHTSLRSLSSSPNNENLGENRLTSNPNSYTSFNGLMAPPVYEQHIYDKLWSDISPVESPINSGSSTPRYSNYLSNGNQDQGDVRDQFSMSPLDSVQLNENLRALSLQRQIQEDDSTPNQTPGSSSRSRPVFNIGENNSQGDYFTRSRSPLSTSSPSASNIPLQSPGLTSPPIHLSRVNSESNLDSRTLSRVPSYTQAMRSDANEDALSPAYEPPLPGSNINLSDMDRRVADSSSPTNTNLKGRLILSRGSSNLNLKGLSSNSRGSSLNSSPSNSRNVSSSNLAALSSSPGNLSRTSSKKSIHSNGNNSSASSSSNTPVSSSPGLKAHDLPPHLLPNHSSSSTSITKPSSSASDRNAALLGSSYPKKTTSSLNINVPFLLKKSKDKK
ncbi:unnamed protein product [Debaryomyces tyrocola]|nr:unnamed protein product [Debaryomyces tyrocola]